MGFLRNLFVTENDSDNTEKVSETKFIRTSKHPEKQQILDYMDNLGITIMEYKGIYLFKAHYDGGLYEFYKLFNYRITTRDGFVIVKGENGRSISSYSSLSEAYDMLKKLYNIVINTPSDNDF